MARLEVAKTWNRQLKYMHKRKNRNKTKLEKIRYILQQNLIFRTKIPPDTVQLPMSQLPSRKIIEKVKNQLIHGKSADEEKEQKKLKSKRFVASILDLKVSFLSKLYIYMTPSYL